MNINYINSLPVDVLENCFSFLNDDDLFSCKRVKKEWNKALSSPQSQEAWKGAALSLYPKLRSLITNSASEKVQWKNQFALSKGQEEYLRKGPLVLHTIKESSEPTICIIFKDTIIAGHKDGVIRIYELAGKLLFTLEGHTDSISCLTAAGDTLVSGSKDTTIRIWNFSENKMQLQRVLKGHEQQIEKLKIAKDDRGSRNILISSAENDIRTWRISTGAHLHSINSGNNVKRMIIINTTLITHRGFSSEVLSWNYLSGNKVENKLPMVVSILKKSDTLICRTLQNKFYFWNITNNIYHKVEIEDGLVTGAQLGNYKDKVLTAPSLAPKLNILDFNKLTYNHLNFQEYQTALFFKTFGNTFVSASVPLSLSIRGQPYTSLSLDLLDLKKQKHIRTLENKSEDADSDTGGLYNLKVQGETIICIRGNKVFNDQIHYIRIWNRPSKFWASLFQSATQLLTEIHVNSTKQKK